MLVCLEFIQHQLLRGSMFMVEYGPARELLAVAQVYNHHYATCTSTGTASVHTPPLKTQLQEPSERRCDDVHR